MAFGSDLWSCAFSSILQCGLCPCYTAVGCPGASAKEISLGCIAFGRLRFQWGEGGRCSANGRLESGGAPTRHDRGPPAANCQAHWCHSSSKSSNTSACCMAAAEVPALLPLVEPVAEGTSTLNAPNQHIPPPCAPYVSPMTLPMLHCN